jgi:hypothetical protein
MSLSTDYTSKKPAPPPESAAPLVVPAADPSSPQFPEAAISGRIMEPDEWRVAKEAHRVHMDAFVEPALQRSSSGQAHPVFDFFLTYYWLKPERLRVWHPAWPHRLALDSTVPDEWTPAWTRAPYVLENRVLRFDENFLTDKKRFRAQWVLTLCENILKRPGHFRCHGLHEWAMVYRIPPEQIRHQNWPLRLSPDEINDVVDQGNLHCTHHDAFRFFTAEASPRNACHPTLETRHHMEQPGCLHTNMDLYKWCYKLLPWVGSDLLRDAFDLAMKARIIDMRASPYDFQSLGYEAIAIETPAGRKSYETCQRDIAAEARPIRERLVNFLVPFLKATVPITPESGATPAHESFP